MFSPGDSGPPPLVDANPPPFIPPPFGASNGGQPGFFDAFPGARGGGGGGDTSNDWIPGRGTPYPTQRPPPSAISWGAATPAMGPNASSPWTYGNYVPASAPAWPPPGATTPVWGNPMTPTTPWGATPAPTWGASPGATSWGVPATPANYPPWSAPPVQVQAPQPRGGGGGGWFGGPSAPGTPYDSDQPITAGWFGAGAGAGAVGGGGGGGGGGEGVWGEQRGWGDNWAGGWGRQSHTPGPELERKRSGRSRHRSHSQSAMKRSNSMGADDGRVQRSTSWGGANAWGRWNDTGNGWGSTTATWGSQPAWAGGESRYPQSAFPGYAQGDLFDERNLARRPRDWRADYNPRGIALATYLPRVGRNRSDVKEWADVTRRALHPLLHFQPSAPPVFFDLRPPTLAPTSIAFLNLPRQPNNIDFAQLAFQPSAPFARLYHPKLPWYVDVHQNHPSGITVWDVLEQLHAQLQTPIHPRHFWNEELGEQERLAITLAFQARCGQDRTLVGRGVVQLDFLGKKVVFEGLARGPKGLWEIKATRGE
ncbi:unnamed protein product [Cyclocybe aegerita]|uniref:DUF6699 domain-containing protein n=1 Tax=Cyclocybe aegerita TaxID=1973307 RepID=A0A8S0WAC7_CYCAE|nr:unnamed protein product [Cyclocybe aegerita]